MITSGTSIYTELSNKHNIPYQVIKVICNHPFLFANRKITEQDERPVMFSYLGKIKIKKIYGKDFSKSKE